jgi:hypothetical protein
LALNGASVHMTNGVIANCSASGGTQAHGGALFASNGVTVELTNVQITGCHASTSSMALYFGDNVAVSNVAVSVPPPQTRLAPPCARAQLPPNSAMRCVVCSCHPRHRLCSRHIHTQASGGALHVVGGSITMVHVQFIGCTVRSWGYQASGGALHASGDATIDLTEVHFTRCTVWGDNIVSVALDERDSPDMR